MSDLHDLIAEIYHRAYVEALEDASVPADFYSERASEGCAQAQADFRHRISSTRTPMDAPEVGALPAEPDRAAGLRPQPPAASSQSSIPSAWPRLSLAEERLHKFAVEWRLLQVRGTRDEIIYALHGGDAREAVCRLDDIIQLLGAVDALRAAQAIEAATAAETANAGSVHESAVGNADAPDPSSGDDTDGGGAG